MIDNKLSNFSGVRHYATKEFYCVNCVRADLLKDEPDATDSDLFDLLCDMPLAGFQLVTDKGICQGCN